MQEAEKNRFFFFLVELLVPFIFLFLQCGKKKRKMNRARKKNKPNICSLHHRWLHIDTYIVTVIHYAHILCVSSYEISKMLSSKLYIYIYEHSLRFMMIY